MDHNKLREEQIKLAGKVVLSNGFDKIKLIAGCDQSSSEDKIISTICIFDFKTQELIEKKHSIINAEMPYIPGLLSYREAPAISETYQQLENEPDLLLIKGNGILHPRKFGIASHMGLLLNKPTIGIAKKLLCGKKEGDTVYLGKDAVGKEVVIKKKANAVYVSPGHMITLAKAIEITKGMAKDPYKLPYPIAIAHKYSAKVKRKELKG